MSDILEAKVMVFPYYTASIICPHCERELSDWHIDPRGCTVTCDDCEKDFYIPHNVEVIFE